MREDGCCAVICIYLWRVRGRDRERAKERESHEEEKGREEDEKKGAFAQHLPDYSFRRPGGFTDGERLRQRKNQRRSDRDEENGAP